MSETNAERPVLDLLATMTEASVDASSLDADALMLVRIAALAAVDAPAVSYLLNLERPSRLDGRRADPRCARGDRADVGTARVASATVNLVTALAVEIDIAELEDEGEV